MPEEMRKADAWAVYVECSWAKWRIHWKLHDCDTSIIEADTEDDALEIFAEMALTEIVGTDQNFAEILQIGRADDGRERDCQ